MKEEPGRRITASHVKHLGLIGESREEDKLTGFGG